MVELEEREGDEARIEWPHILARARDKPTMPTSSNDTITNDLG